MALGYLTASEYKNACETSDVGFRMAEWGVIEAMQHITRFIKSGRNIEWISVKCPAKMVERVDFYKWMKRLIKENDFRYPKNLCLEFEASLFEQKTEEARLAVLDMKLLGVKTMVMADENTSVSKLVDVPVDIVLLAPSLTRWTGSRNKPQLIPTMVSYLKSMRAEVYADGVLNKDQILLLSRSECGGYATDPSYKGENATIHFAGVRKAFEQKDTEEDFEI
jgi:EAL domain-containing protein (putative c-di-GMP-specific phosphodiesterase class I)